ncbi:DEAD/DEAH box helicase [Paracraurococcus lichenis]|uniref:SNF2-related protein n=1 Tax=Paracraurococcus lichenis TaxID=3064888 RepID=A0ABT9EC71_9PROT|nr:SNF2-related protein [Paracraurococcus sp. LOR1-02]MDO9713490.1 SNF2-related protein [Paracraurococcus sp. LOR1-02]
MPLLRAREWRLKYTPDHGDLVRGLYVPLLECAVRYDRLTGYFSASALALAARGVEGLVQNDGRMRMVVGCTLAPEEATAIQQGAKLRDQVEAHLAALPLMPTDTGMAQALELLAWLVAQGRLEVKVAVPCDAHRRPVAADGLFHEKAGLVEDNDGKIVAFNGSLNETAAGWTKNWESVNVFTSWRDPERVREEAENFGRLWADKAKHVITLDVPAAAQADLMRFLPPTDLPARLKKAPPPEPVAPEPEPAAPPSPVIDLRSAVWSFIRRAPTLPGGGVRVAEATSAITPWPHQIRAFHRLYDQWPPKLLIADEVGLGKTIQAGLLLRQAWLAGRARRILILAPKAVCRQWQIELREKFNLNWPIYDGQKLNWYPSPAMRGRHEKPVSRAEWHKEEVVIASSHLLRRTDRSKEALEAAEPWDLVVLDEAHHARRRGAGSAQEGGPNALLRLMRGLKERTQGLVLLTATPMQVHAVEVYDLLSLLGLPPEWHQSAFLRFFDDVQQDSPSHEAFDRMAAMFRAVEAAYGPVGAEAVQRLGVQSPLRAKKILAALRDPASIPRRMLEASDRKAALRLMRLNTPINRLVSRHTRELLRAYYKAGKLKTRIADRRVEDRFIDLSPEERAIYDAVEDYIANTYNQTVNSDVSAQKRSAIGFVMTIYRRRLASSFLALRQTLEGHLQAIGKPTPADLLAGLTEGAEDDEGEEPDEDEAAKLAQEALAMEERSEIEKLIGMIRHLPAADTKCEKLRQELADLRADGHRQAMVFTQFTDTMDFLRTELGRDSGLRIMCFSGRGGEIANSDGTWRVISRDDVKRRFREGAADVLLCTDAAAEGLNFQFCGALINYDMPWNPMRVEQRIGRIDRLGQQYPDIRIVNLHYADTVETDVYVALRHRIGLFEQVVGGLQPILARMPSLISGRVLTGQSRDEAARQEAVREIEAEASRAQQRGGFDIDKVTDADLTEPPRPAPALTMDDLERVIASPALLPPGIEVVPMRVREWGFLQPGMAERVRVSTDATYYEQNSDSVEFWSPGNPTFPVPAVTGDVLLISRLFEVLSREVE